MKILFLAPHPYFIDRGTPIAVDYMLRVLSERGDRVDLVTYHEGRNIPRENVHIHRIVTLPFVKNIRPGLSWKKIVCDVVMVVTLIPMLIRTRYDVIHAVEESVFMALVAKFLFRIPYVYDMDSSLSLQIMDKLPHLKAVASILTSAEKIAVKNSLAVIPVCQALVDVAKKFAPSKASFLLQDISLLDERSIDNSQRLRRELSIDGLIFMYIGNLEVYQGIDLLLESFGSLSERISASVIIIGGNPADIQKYKRKSAELRLQSRVHFLGPKPIAKMSEFIHQADILVSPRIQGNNTPMKIYSYLHSGKAVLATKIESHTQVLTDKISMLALPNPGEFAEAMLTLINDDELRQNLGHAGKKFAEENHSYASYKKKVFELYNWISTQIIT